MITKLLSRFSLKINKLQKRGNKNLQKNRRNYWQTTEFRNKSNLVKNQIYGQILKVA